jgi:prepilin-type N-terminal cleavage/methylation domain-containing protein
MKKPILFALIAKGKRGFTLVEVLVSMTIIAVLFLVVLIALDPIYNFAEARNARRWSHINSLNNAIYGYIVDTNAFPPGISEQEKQIGTAITGCSDDCVGAEDACLDLFPDLDAYMEFFPVDPSYGSPGQTKYSVRKTEDNIIIIKACQPENGETILMAR